MAEGVKHGSLLTGLAWFCMFVGFTAGQVPSPESNPCSLYDLNTGVVTPNLTDLFYTINESDNSSQSVRLEISGGSKVFGLSGTSDYDITFVFLGGYWTMLINSSIDRDGASPGSLDDVDVLTLEVQCTYYPAGQPSTTDLYITLRINDLNDNSPVFEKHSYSVSIPESMNVMSTVLAEVTATDKDQNEFRGIAYSIGGGATYNGVTYFSIDPGTGIIKLEKRLDFEQLYYDYNHTVFDVVILAKDNPTLALTGDQHTSSTTVSIRVTDSDDLPPSFYYPNCNSITNFVSTPIPYWCVAVTYSADITSTGAGNFVPGEVTMFEQGTTNQTTIRALDLDTLNASLSFKVLETYPKGYEQRFVVHSTSDTSTIPGRISYIATVKQIASISRADISRFSMSVRAFQQNNELNFETAIIGVTVHPAN